ncbi:unnamed protein product [Caenorhabditis auriculariae]|uniref:Sodium/hydrogen exchanger n=1 Tax=Caenorhabditis auriculariae TaxID=2777116 RepID=A0A8S1HRH0_9PELO|nr:unnamed protein product [Caenorhabditis auriculariae]
MRKKVNLSVLFFLFLSTKAQEVAPARFQILNPKWEEMESLFVLAIWVLLTGLVKVFLTKIKPVVKIVPDSAMQIILGIGLAGLFAILGLDRRFYVFDSYTFFAFLLPPIIFDAGYFMPNRAFFENFDSIMSFAVVGTVFNTFAIGGSLALLNHFDWFSVKSSTSEIFLFASLISAVDPVELNVNKMLFVTVFGEALFNDAISVVLYGIFKSFTVASDSLEAGQLFLGFIAFFVVAFGGVVVGITSAALSALATKITGETPIIAPLLALVVPYIGYILSEVISFSSIIAAAVCGMAMKQYVKSNMDQPGVETVRCTTRILAISSETATFLLLGLATISVDHHWDTVFVCSTVLFCLVYRVVAILVLSLLLKITRGNQISLVNRMIICYGGLRGPIAFGLVVSMPAFIVGKSMFTTAVLAVIFFSVILQGTTIRPLLSWLKVERDEVSTETVTSVMQSESLDYAISGIESIAGTRTHQRINQLFERVNSKFLRPVLTRNTRKLDHEEEKIARTVRKVVLQEAINEESSNQWEMREMKDSESKIKSLEKLLGPENVQLLHNVLHSMSKAPPTS